jgi:uncharacterized protein
MRFISFLVCSILWLHGVAQPTHPIVKPNIQKVLLNDFAGILTPKQKDTLQNQLQHYFTASGNVVVVIIIPTLTDSNTTTTYTIEEVAKAFFDNWGIGSKKKSNGVLLLVALQSRKVRIALGAGFNRKKYDPVCQQIIDDDILPRFKKGYYYEGIHVAVTSIQQKLF